MTQPAPQSPYPQANSYAGYYGAYGYTPWYPPATLPPVPAERPARPGRARIANALIAAAVALVTLGAIALAALAPSLAPADTAAPGAGLSQLYAASLASDAGHWDTSSGCVFADGGLHATRQFSATLCDFRPDAAPDLASSGFYLVADVGPAAAVAGQQKPCIEIRAGEDVVTLAFDQQGAYGLHLVGASAECAIGSGLTATETYSWHTNGITPNRIGMRYDASAGTLTVYANGLMVTKVRSVQLSSPVTLRLGASADGEALFTHFSLYA
jgi:hypothetical protein